MESEWDCIRKLEDSLMNTWMLTKLVVESLTSHLDGDSNFGPGLLMIQNVAFTETEAAFDAVLSNYVARLKSQTKKRR